MEFIVKLLLPYLQPHSLEKIFNERTTLFYPNNLYMKKTNLQHENKQVYVKETCETSTQHWKTIRVHPFPLANA